MAECAVRPVPVVVVLVLAERCRGVPPVDDRDSVEELAADGADETFGDGIGPRCADRRPDDRTLSAVNTTSNAAVNLVSRACRVPGFQNSALVDLRR